jgi:hypothetical protein
MHKADHHQEGEKQYCEHRQDKETAGTAGVSGLGVHLSTRV